LEKRRLKTKAKQTKGQKNLQKKELSANSVSIGKLNFPKPKEELNEEKNHEIRPQSLLICLPFRFTITHFMLYVSVLVVTNSLAKNTCMPF
jgi:hypothetical protein